MRFAVACDHGGFALKEAVILTIQQEGHEVLDLGTHDAESVDYPDYAEKVGRAIQNNEAQRGILICGSGIGASIAANKLVGVYAGVCHDTYSAHQGVEHDDMNVLCLGARIVGPELAKELVKMFVNAHFSQEERHVRRVKKVRELESGMRSRS